MVINYTSFYFMYEIFEACDGVIQANNIISVTGKLMLIILRHSQWRCISTSRRLSCFFKHFGIAADSCGGAIYIEECTLF